MVPTDSPADETTPSNEPEASADAKMGGIDGVEDVRVETPIQEVEGKANGTELDGPDPASLPDGEVDRENVRNDGDAPATVNGNNGHGTLTDADTAADQNHVNGTVTPPNGTVEVDSEHVNGHSGGPGKIARLKEVVIERKVTADSPTK